MDKYLVIFILHVIFSVTAITLFLFGYFMESDTLVLSGMCCLLGVSVVAGYAIADHINDYLNQ